MKQIGKYAVIKELGSGGFGAVYLAEDPRLGEKVAIKVFEIRDDNAARLATNATADAGEVLKERFLNEARTLRKLNRNSHIVDVFEFDELEGGTPYYVMPYLPHSLRNELGSDATDASVIAELEPEDKPRLLPFTVAVNYLEQLLKGLSDVHKAGLVHRDIKPANLLINEHGEIQLCDFGIAKVPDTEHSNSGIGMGSRNYMSPEQRQSAKHVDARSDIYSVGVLAYRMITGTLPEGRFAEPKKYQPALSDSLNELILTALEQKKEDRFADAAVMLQALKQTDATKAGQPDEATGTWVGGTDDIKPELKPLEQKIIQLLQSNGEVQESDLPVLQALADLGGLTAAELHALIDKVAEQQASQSPQQKAFQQWVANINNALARGDALSPQQCNVLVEAGEASTGKPIEELKTVLAGKGLTFDSASATSSIAADDVTLVAKPGQSGSGGAGKWLGIAALLIVLAGGGYFGFGYYQQMQEQERQAEVARKNEQAQLSAEKQRAEQVKKAQRYLKDLGYEVAENGTLDTRTQKAVEAFEKSENMLVSGTVDEILLANVEKRLKAIDDKAFVLAQKQNTSSGYRSYLRGYPEGAHREEAERAFLQASNNEKKAEDKERDERAWFYASGTNSIAAYQTYTDNHPNGQYLKQAEMAIKRIRLEQSKVILNIIVSPAEAKIEITNINEKYRYGLKLVPDKYTVKISQKGYEPLTETILLKKDNNTFRYELKRQIPESIKNLIKSMKPIPAGNFTMGCSAQDTECDNDEKPRHTVNIKAFSILESEVTWDMYVPCIDDGVCKSAWNPGEEKNEHPVVNVSYDDISEHYIPWLNELTGQSFRLPSEAEWEYAALVVIHPLVGGHLPE